MSLTCCLREYGAGTVRCDVRRLVTGRRYAGDRQLPDDRSARGLGLGPPFARPYPEMPDPLLTKRKSSRHGKVVGSFLLVSPDVGARAVAGRLRPFFIRALTKSG